MFIGAGSGTGRISFRLTCFIWSPFYNKEIKWETQQVLQNKKRRQRNKGLPARRSKRSIEHKSLNNFSNNQGKTN
jgi:hypothetical protein